MTEVEDIIYELEMSLLKPEVRLSFKQLDLLLADYFIEFGSEGLIYGKKDVIQALITNSDKVKFIVTDFKVKKLADDIIQTMFKTERIINNKDIVISLRSSLWNREGKQWQMFFHQGTPMRK